MEKDQDREEAEKRGEKKGWLKQSLKKASMSRELSEDGRRGRQRLRTGHIRDGKFAVQRHQIPDWTEIYGKYKCEYGRPEAESVERGSIRKSGCSGRRLQDGCRRISCRDWESIIKKFRDLAALREGAQ